MSNLWIRPLALLAAVVQAVERDTAAPCRVVGTGDDCLLLTACC